MSQDWYKNFFQGLSVDLWCAATTAEQTAAEVRGVLEMLALPTGALILDMPCGSARHSIELAKAGYRVTAVDLSTQFLDVAKRSAAEADVSIDFRQADMYETQLDGPFDGAVCLGNSFHYGSEAQTAGLVKRIASALRSGGRFVLDCGAAAEGILPNLKDEPTYEFGGVTMEIRNHYCTRNSRLETDFTFTSGDRVERQTSWHWVYTSGQICRMLEDAGMKVIGLYRSLDRQPFELRDQYLYLLSERLA